MNGSFRVCLLLVGITLLVTGTVWARSSATVVIPPREVVEGDRWVAGQLIRNEGTVRGDLVFAGQNISSTGTIEGDAIGAGQDIFIGGSVLGDVRAAGASVNLAGHIGKNVNAAGANVSLARGGTIEGTMRAFAASVNLDGKVRGKTRIGARTIVLGGEFLGDVDVNNYDRHKPRAGDGREKTKLTVLPGAVIHGTLTFRGESADIQKGAQVKDFQWAKPPSAQAGKERRVIYRHAWKFVRLLFTIAVYFLMGLLLLKTFPTFFRRAVGYLGGKPWNALDYGAIRLTAGFAVAIACIVLLVLSVIMSPAFGIVSSLGAIAFYAGLFLFAAIPVSLWLGSLMFNEKSEAYRLGAGLVVLNVGLFVFMLLGLLPLVGPVFSGLSFAIKLAVLLLGTGGLIHALRKAVSPDRSLEG